MLDVFIKMSTFEKVHVSLLDGIVHSDPDGSKRHLSLQAWDQSTVERFGTLFLGYNACCANNPAVFELRRLRAGYSQKPSLANFGRASTLALDL